MPVSKPATNFPWLDTGATFPAGSDPWSGQPKASDPLEDFFTPGRTQPAEELNSLLKDRDVCMDALVDAVNAMEPDLSLKETKRVTGTYASYSSTSHNVYTAGTFDDGGSGPYVIATFTNNAVVGDWIEVVFSGAAVISQDDTTARSAHLQLQMNQNGGSYAEVGGATAEFRTPGNTEDANGVGMPFCMTGWQQVTTAGPVSVKVVGRIDNPGSGNGLTWWHAFQFTGRIWRPV